MHTTESGNKSVTEYKPELLSRRGEFIAWTLCVILLVTWALLSLLEQKVFLGLPILTFFMMLAACGISLGNWMDRHTTLSLQEDGVHFENGLRTTSLKWDEIQQAHVLPSSWGDKVYIIGAQARFAFRTLGEVKLQDEVKGHMGFARGEYILKQIIEKSGLEPVEPVDTGTKVSENSDSGYYFGRK